MIMGRIFGYKRPVGTEGWRKLRNWKLHKNSKAIPVTGYGSL
jgi:hypothetical protein